MTTVPLPRGMELLALLGGDISSHWYTKDELLAYGRACAEAEREALREKVRELREALSEIETTSWYAESTLHGMREIARAALAATKGET